MPDKDKLINVFREIGVKFTENDEEIIVRDEDLGDYIAFIFDQNGNFLST
jgi:hypothetical protein